MVFVTYKTIEPNRARIMAVIYKHEGLFEEQKKSGFYADHLPEPDASKEGTPVLYANPETKELWYEYLPAPEAPLYANTTEGRLQKEIDDLKLLLAELVAGGTL